MTCRFDGGVHYVSRLVPSLFRACRVTAIKIPVRYRSTFTLLRNRRSILNDDIAYLRAMAGDHIDCKQRQYPMGYHNMNDLEG